MAGKKLASVFQDLYAADRAAKMEIRAQLLHGLARWLDASGRSQIEAAQALGVTQARVSHLNRGEINRFSVDMLVRLACKRGDNPRGRW